MNVLIACKTANWLVKSAAVEKTDYADGVQTATFN